MTLPTKKIAATGAIRIKRSIFIMHPPFKMKCSRPRTALMFSGGNTIQTPAPPQCVLPDSGKVPRRRCIFLCFLEPCTLLTAVSTRE
jgi:hypothetical protein